MSEAPLVLVEVDEDAPDCLDSSLLDLYGTTMDIIKCIEVRVCGG